MIAAYTLGIMLCMCGWVWILERRVKRLEAAERRRRLFGEVLDETHAIFENDGRKWQ